MSNDNKKARRKINVIDVVIILLVLALIGTAVYKVFTEISKKQLVKHSKYIVTFECDEEYNSLIKHLKSGDAVYFSANGTLLGYIYDAPGDEKGAVYELVSGEEALDADGDSVYEKVRLGGMMKLASNAVKVKNGAYYTVENVNISKGSTIKVYTEKAVFTLTVKDISEEAE